MIIVHITSRSAWEAAAPCQRYEAPSLATEGFIHCSTIAQAAGTANRYFRGERGLVLLCLDEARLQAEVRYEPPADNPDSPERFPHLYGTLNLDAVVRVLSFEPGPDGLFALPPELSQI